MSSVEKLKKIRNTSINQITEAYAVAIKAQTDPTQKSILVAMYENLEEIYHEFKEKHNEIIGEIEDAEFRSEDAIRKEVDSFYYKIKAAYSELHQDPFQSAHTSHTSQRPQLTSNKDVKLPQLTVPKFDGDLHKWPTFNDIYRSLVHSNDSLTDIEKFQYLLSFLEGEPFNLIKSIQLVSSNYPIAIDTLVKRYENKRILATAYWNAIVAAPNLQNNSSTELRSLLDIFRENLSALEVLHFPVKQWCFVLFNMLLQKLDKSIKTAF